MPKKRGRKPTLDEPVRSNYFIPRSMLNDMLLLDKMAREFGITRYTGAYIVREGIALFMAQEFAALKTAKNPL